MKDTDKVAPSEFRTCAAWLYRNSLGSRGAVLYAGSLGTMATFAGLSVVWLTRSLIDRASSGSAAGAPVGLPVILVVAFLLRIVCSAWAGAVMSRGETVLHDRLRERLFSSALFLPSSLGNSPHSADIAGRLDTDAATVAATVVGTLPRLFVSLLRLAGAVIFLAFLNPGLCLAVLAATLPLFFLTRCPSASLRRLTAALRIAESHVHSFVQEYIEKRMVVRAVDSRVRESVRRLSVLQGVLESSVRNRVRYRAVVTSLLRLTFGAGYLAAFLWGVAGLADGTVSYGTMAAFLQLSVMIQRPILRIGAEAVSLEGVTVAAGRLMELERCNPAEEYGRTSGRGIRLGEVSHYYDREYKGVVIENLSFDFPPGSRTAMTGPTGSGKSTLLRIIAGLETPFAGSVEIYDSKANYGTSPEDNTLPEISPEEIAFMPQGMTLFNGTIRSNLLLALPDATDEQINTALYLAVADEFVTRLPLGIDTPVGQKGEGLSEGEAQRIAVARALLSPAGILLLDEPTSALNESTGIEMIKRIFAADPGRTIVIATHSSSVASLCERSLHLSLRHKIKLHMSFYF